MTDPKATDVEKAKQAFEALGFTVARVGTILYHSRGLTFEGWSWTTDGACVDLNEAVQRVSRSLLPAAGTAHVLSEVWVLATTLAPVDLSAATLHVVDVDDRGTSMLFTWQSSTDERARAEALAPTRARIAACAPEALRMLLEAEWSGANVGDATACPWCTAEKYRDEPHRDYCAWLALMRKAGLR